LLLRKEEGRIPTIFCQAKTAAGRTDLLSLSKNQEPRTGN